MKFAVVIVLSVCVVLAMARPGLDLEKLSHNAHCVCCVFRDEVCRCDSAVCVCSAGNGQARPRLGDFRDEVCRSDSAFCVCSAGNGLT